MTANPLAQALVRWQHAAGPFWPYVCAAPFLGTGDSVRLGASLAPKLQQVTNGHSGRMPSSWDRGDLRDLGSAFRPTICEDRDVARMPHSRERRTHNGGFEVVLADLPAEPLLAAAPRLIADGWYVVPVIQRWIASPAVLPCRRLLELLLRGARSIRRPARPRGALLLADGDRTGPPSYPAQVAGRTFDNRYEYQICRFPSTRFLHKHGVRQVRWLTTERPTFPGPIGPELMMLGLPPVARDLHPYREMLLQAGIEVAVSITPAPAEVLADLDRV